MKRSGDVTAAAIILFVGSVLLLLMAAVAVLGLLVGARSAAAGSTPLPQNAFAIFAVIVYVVPAGWGIATGVGILQLRPWARISMIVMSIFAIFGCVCGAIGILAAQTVLKGDPQMPPEAVRMILVMSSIIFLIPLGIAIWWLALFTRKRVIAEFATRGVAPSAIMQRNAPLEIAPGGTSTESESAAVPFVAAQANPGIPLSIRIITIFFLLGSAMGLLSLELVVRMHMPSLVLGFLVEGRSAWTFFAAFAVVQLVICIAVLKKRAWALDGLIAVSIFSALNVVLMAISPSRNVFFDKMIQAESLLQTMNADAMRDFMGVIFPLSAAVGAVLTLVMLYFLFTRRAAFRAACAARTEST